VQQTCYIDLYVDTSVLEEHIAYIFSAYLHDVKTSNLKLGLCRNVSFPQSLHAKARIVWPALNYSTTVSFHTATTFQFIIH
jgi:hypothetical protein